MITGDVQKNYKQEIENEIMKKMEYEITSYISIFSIGSMSRKATYLHVFSRRYIFWLRN